MSVVERLQFGDIEGIRTGRYRLGINTSCIVYRLGGTVLDTGPPNQWRFVRRFLEERGIQRVLVTHHHEDHSGNCSRIRHELDAPIYAPAQSLQRLRDGFPLRLYQKIIWGRPARFVCEQLPKRIDIGDGLTLRPVSTPGHSADMTCYLEPNRGWLFSGDLYIASRTRHLRADEDIDALMASLAQVLELDFETLFCAHRGIVREGQRAIARKYDFLSELTGRVQELHGRGQSVTEISRALVGKEGWLRFVTAGHFSTENLIRACLAVRDQRS